MATDKFELKAIITAVDKLSPVLKGVQRAIKGTHKNLRDMGTAGSELSAKLGIPLALLGGASVAGLTRAVGAFMQFGSAVHDASQKIGVMPEELQKLQFAAKLAGVAPESLNASLAKLNKNIGEAAAGKNKDLANMFKKFGISIKDANGNVRTASDLMPQLADAIAKNENPAKRARIAVEAFGKSGQDLIPMLSEGSEGLAKAAKEADNLGIVLSGAQVKAADDLGDTFDKLKMSAQGLGMSIVAQLAPVLTPLVEGLTKWIVANRELIGQKVHEVVKRLSDSIENIDWNAVQESILAVGDAISWAADAVGGWSNLLIGLVAIANAGVIASLLEIGLAAYRFIPILFAFGKVLAMWVIANPMLALITASVYLLGLAVFKIYQNWDGIAAWFADLWQSIKTLFADGVQFLTDAFLNWSPLGLVIKNWEPIVNWFASLWERVRGFIEPITRGVAAAGEFFGIGAPAQRPALASTGALQASNGQAKLNGEVLMRFEGAPPGFRVDPVKTNQTGVSFNPDVGYRSDALGMA